LRDSIAWGVYATPRLAAFTLILVACPGPAGSDVPEGCECIPDDDATGYDWAPPSWPTCGEDLCATVDASGNEYDGEFMLTNPEALDCALMALRDRSPGIVRWSWEENGGQFSDFGYILVQPEGTVVHRRWGAEDLGWDVSDAQAGELPSAQYYDDCLAQPDALVRFDCLRDLASAQTTVCDEGWSNTSI
jgi:hypothetical protein